MRFLLFFIFLMHFFNGFAQDFSGSWKGNLAIDKDTLALIIHVRQENSQWMASMDIPSQNGFKLPTKVSIANKEIEIETVAEIRIKGNMVAANEINAVFSQSGFTTDIKFNRVLDTNELAKSYSLKRPQEPQGPFPYDSKDFIVENDLVKLSGTITSPKGEGKYPAVIMLSGSGTQDRDGTLFGHKPFKVLADYLTRQGIVVMRFDDVGIGGSTGRKDYIETTLTQAKNVKLLLNRLKSEPKADLNKVGLIGHSEGSLISLIEGARNGDIKFIVSLAGPGLSGKEILVKQSTDELKSLPPEKQKMYSSLLDIMDKAEDDDVTRDNMEKIVDNYQGNTPLNAADTTYFIRISNPWMLCFARLNPAVYMQQIKVPVLVLNGGKDIQVQADENVNVFKRSLPKNSKSHTKIYPELNHLFQTAKTGSVMEYQQLEETFNEEVMRDIISWIGKL